jgi:hypothetical protein
MNPDRATLQRLESDFVEMILSRGRQGALDYGEFAFMRNNTFEMLYEELADICNYCRFTYIKLRLFQEAIQHALSTDCTNTDAGGDSS